MTNKSIKKTTKSHQTDNRRFNILLGVLLAFILTATPFLFYLYKFAPKGVTSWETSFGTIESGGFKSVPAYLHALVTKLTFVILTTLWFLTSRNWWKYAILVPLTMFLFQLAGVINYKNSFIDEFDFWYSLPVILPIILLLIYISYRISKHSNMDEELNKDAEDAIKKLMSDDL